MIAWTPDQVAERFEEAVRIGNRLPRVQVQGYFNVWPTMVRGEHEGYAEVDPPLKRVAPQPREVDRVLEVMAWIGWLDVPVRHLVWMRAKGDSWPHIAKRFALHRTTLWRWHQKALELIADRLNAERVPV